jgi:hypothetical protein
VKNSVKKARKSNEFLEQLPPLLHISLGTITVRDKKEKGGGK